MRLEDIHSYKDLDTYIHLELANQTLTRKIVRIELNDEWFFKLSKLVLFSLKHDKNESKIEPSPDCKKMIMKINKVFTIVTRK